MKKPDTINPEKLSSYREIIRRYANTGKYQKAYVLISKLLKKHPDHFELTYLEAVFSAEDTRGLTETELKRRYKAAAAKLKKLTHRLRGVDGHFAARVRNEYYWFSGQALKQYRLGVESVGKGHKKSYYSQGVGACQMARSYAKKGQRRLCLKWAKISEQAWKNYFKVVPNWFNSYIFYATVLGFQGKKQAMYAAIQRGSDISGISVKDETFTRILKELQELGY